jgi:RNA polymerase sigma factor (sigma-70 family)
MENRQDLDEIYRRHGPAVLRRARQLLGNDGDAEEALQDIFLSLARQPAQFGGRSAMTTFLYSVTTHLCLNRLRDVRRRRALLAASGTAGPGVALPARTDGATAERAAILRQLVARMPEDLAAPAVYYYLDEMTHEEIAEVLGCSRRHVGDLVTRARAWVMAEVGP